MPVMRDDDVVRANRRGPMTALDATFINSTPSAQTLDIFECHFGVANTISNCLTSEYGAAFR